MWLCGVGVVYSVPNPPPYTTRGDERQRASTLRSGGSTLGPGGGAGTNILAQNRP